MISYVPLFLKCLNLCNVLRIAQAKAAKSGAKADIIGKPLELYNRAQSFLDRGLTQAAGYLDSSFAGPYIERAAIYVEKAKCAAYEGCVNGLQKLIPGSNGTRIMQGGGLVLGGIFKGLGGVMLSAASATFSWTGIAVPGIGAGVVTASAGASDIYQGIEEISLGVKGDSETKTSNGLSDMLYGGNDGIYHASTGIAAISGSLLIPYVKTAYSKTPVVTGEGAAGQAGGAEGGSETKYSPVNPGPLSEDVASSFSGATYTERVLTEDTVMYRVSGGNAKEVGSYMSMTPQEGGLQSQIDLALNPAWGNTTENVTKIVVPKGTIIYEGVAAPQNIYDSLGNVIGTLPGGGNQVYIPTVEAGWFQ